MESEAEAEAAEAEVEAKVEAEVEVEAERDQQCYTMACPGLGPGLGSRLNLGFGLVPREHGERLQLGWHARERLQLVLELSDRGRARDRDLVPPRAVSHPDLHGCVEAPATASATRRTRRNSRSSLAGAFSTLDR